MLLLVSFPPGDGFGLQKSVAVLSTLRTKPPEPQLIAHQLTAQHEMFRHWLYIPAAKTETNSEEGVAIVFSVRRRSS